MLHRLFVAPVMEGDPIIGIITESKAGREAILAAPGRRRHRAMPTSPTGRAHRCYKTPPEQMQAASVMFHLAGVDKAAFLAAVRRDPQTYKDWSAGEWTVETPTGRRTTCSRRSQQAVRAGDRRRGDPGRTSTRSPAPGARCTTRAS